MIAASCAGADRAARAPAAQPSAEPAKAQTPTVDGASADGPVAPKGEADKLFPVRKTGWIAVDDSRRARIEELAARYIRFLGKSRTARDTVVHAADMFRAAGGSLLVAGRKYNAGDRLYAVDKSGRAAVFVRVGTRPVTDGLRVVAAPIDAPHLLLKQAPVTRRYGFSMFDTYAYGGVELRHWTVTPLALHVRAARVAGAPRTLVIGDDEGEPIFSVPDLLPHLSRKLQSANKEFDAERIDALAAQSERALAKALERYDLTVAELASAEAVLVPITRPRFIGVDRGLVGGYGQIGRALAFAAVDAVARANPGRTAVVVLFDRSLAGGSGRAGSGFGKRALEQVIEALWPSKSAPDMLDSQRILHRSIVLAGRSLDGSLGRGATFNYRGDDALPVGADLVLRAFRDAGAAYQHSTEAAFGGFARTFSTLDVAAVDISIPVKGRGRPHQLLSTIDLFDTNAGLVGYFEYQRGVR